MAHNLFKQENTKITLFVIMVAVTGALPGQKTLEGAALSTMTELADCFAVADRTLTF